MDSKTDIRDVPPEQALLVLDMKGYGQIRECRMSPVRGDLDDVLAHVFAQSGLAEEWGNGEPYKDTGDGAIFVLPPARMWRIVDPLLTNLDQALARYDRDRMARTPAIHLRASIHVGPLTVEDRRGDAINDACRLVNSDIAYAAMAAAVEHGAYVAAVLSKVAFMRTVGAGRSERLSEEHFLSANARVPKKPSFSEPAHVHVPGVSPASIAEQISALSDEDPQGDVSPTSSVPQPPSESMQASAAPKFQFNNTNVGTVADHIDTIHQPINFPNS